MSYPYQPCARLQANMVPFKPLRVNPVDIGSKVPRLDKMAGSRQHGYMLRSSEAGPFEDGVIARKLFDSGHRAGCPVDSR